MQKSPYASDAPPYARAATRTWIERTSSDPWYLSQMRLGKTALYDVLGMTPLFHKKEWTVSGIMYDRMARLIDPIEARELIFPHRGKGNSMDRSLPRYIWVEPQSPPPVLRRIARLAQWSLFARCTCGSNQWLPVVIDNAEHVCCYRCLPPSQFPSIGAKAVKRSIITAAVKQHYL